MPWRAVGVFALLTAFVAAAVALVAKPSEQGLIAFELGGDIYVGDPVTGESTAIVAGPAHESSPRFAPDGRLIAFARSPQGTTDENDDTWPWSAAQGDLDIVIVRPDGSGERVITPSGFVGATTQFGWTPDSRAIVAVGRNDPPPAYHGGSGVSLLDVNGQMAPRLLVPPFGTICPCFEPVNDIAAEFRPPHGDQVLTWDTNRLGVLDLATEKITPVGRETLGSFEPYFPTRLSWSPDGSMIAFTLRRSDAMFGEATEDIGSFVMDADGSELRRIPNGGYWSPDSKHLAFVIEGAPRSIAIYNLGSGVERVVNSGADAAHWSWSPDGDSILVTREDGRLEVIQIATGAVSMPPWVVTAPPSWQMPSTK